MLMVIFICLIFVFSLVSGRLEKTIVTAPILFTLAGMAVFLLMDSTLLGPNHVSFLTLAEIGLVLLLFTGASRTDLRILRDFRALPARWGQILNLSVFFLFGLMFCRDRALFGFAPFLYGFLSLTIVRLLPVALALAGTGLSRATIAFMGWFGPRGLASIVLGLVYLEEEKHLPGEQITRLAVMATVLLSILAHGLTAVPGIRLHARLTSSG